MPPLVFKPLGRDNVIVNPFKAYKTQALTFISGSGVGTSSFTIASAIDFADPNSFSPNSAVTNSDGTYQGLLFKSVEHIFYTSGVLSGSADFAAGSTGIRNFPLSGSAYVVNIPQTKFGEGIRPGTFQMTDPDSTLTSSIPSIVDDGQGKLLISGTSAVVGNIFYDLGVAVVKKTTWAPNFDPFLKTWWEADASVTGTVAGAGVPSIADLSGRGFTLSLASTTTGSYQPNQLNGLPAIRFQPSGSNTDAGGILYTTAASAWSGTSPWTAIWVLRPINVGVTNAQILTMGVASGFRNGWNSNGKSAITLSGVAGYLSNTIEFVAGIAMVGAWVYDPSIAKVSFYSSRISGWYDGSQNVGVAGPSVGIWYVGNQEGSFADNTAFWGDLFAMIFINRAMSNAEVLVPLRAYASKYGIVPA